MKGWISERMIWFKIGWMNEWIREWIKGWINKLPVVWLVSPLRVNILPRV